MLHKFYSSISEKYCNEISKIAVGFGILCVRFLLIDLPFLVFVSCMIIPFPFPFLFERLGEEKNDGTCKKANIYPSHANIPSMHSNDKTWKVKENSNETEKERSKRNQTLI